MYNITAQGDNPTFGAPTGVYYDGDQIKVRLTDDGTGRVLAWNAKYQDKIAVLPLASTTSKEVCVLLEYNSVDDKFDCMFAGEEA